MRELPPNTLALPLLFAFNMKRAAYRESIGVILCLAAIAAGLSGCSSEKPTPPADPATAAAAGDPDQPVEVYTNEDLDRLPSPTELPPDDGSPGVVVAEAPEPEARPEPKK